MGLDCRIVAVPVSSENHTLGFVDVSPFLGYGYFRELPDAWDEHRLEPEFSHDVYYCRKNWYLFEFVTNWYSSLLKANNLDSNGCYFYLTEGMIDEYIMQLRQDKPEGFHEKTEDCYTLYHVELNKMIRLKAVMEMYRGVLDFYFEGDY